MYRLTLIGFTLLLSACISIPEQLNREFNPVSPQQVESRDIGTQVRWGGVIIASMPEAEQTCFELLSRDLDHKFRPLNEDRTLGRFVVCEQGFLDPAIYKEGRELTVTGSIDTLENKKIGDYDYQYPIINANFLALWEERPDVVVYQYDSFFWPHYRPYYWHHPYPYYSRHRVYRPHRTGHTKPVEKDRH